jgi:hypothetical protein
MASMLEPLAAPMTGSRWPDTTLDWCEHCSVPALASHKGSAARYLPRFLLRQMGAHNPAASGSNSAHCIRPVWTPDHTLTRQVDIQVSTLTMIGPPLSFFEVFLKPIWWVYGSEQ